MTSVVERLYQRANQKPEKLVVAFEEAEISYGELWDKAVRLAHLFKERGLREGDRAVCQCRYDLYYTASIYAVHLCGAAVVPVDKNADSEMIADMVGHVDANFVICNQKAEHFPNCVLYDELIHTLPDDSSMDGLAFPDPDSVAVILFTTGTTGASKGVQLTQRNITAWADNKIENGRSESYVYFAAVPLNHGASFMRLHQTIYTGGTVIFMESMMKIGRMFEYVDKYGVNALYFPPSAITLLERLSKEKLAQYSDQLDYIITGSAAMMVSQRDYLKKMLPHTPLYTAYACSEAGLVTLYRYDNCDRPVNCCGKACPGVELRIVDDAFQALPAGQIGLIAVKSDIVMKGYYKRPDLNEAVLRDGFFISNDLGYLDEEGYLYVVGRSDDMINIGGLKVFPFEIENAALRIPGIEECICFGVPDPITGRSVKLLIKTGDSFTGSVALVQEELSKVMDYYKVPKNIEIVDEIEMTANGKPNRKFYQDQAQ